MKNSWKLLVILLFVICSCSGVDKSSVRPTAGAPESVRVDNVSVPFDNNMSTYVIAVEPIRLTGDIAVQVEKRVGTLSGQGSGQSSYNSNDNYGSHQDTRVTDQRRNQVVEEEQSAKGQQKKAATLPLAPGSPVIAVSMGQGGTTANNKSKQTRDERESGDYFRHEQGTAQRQVSNSARGSGNFTVSGTSEVRRESYVTYLAPDAIKMKAQLTSALSGVANFKVLTLEAVQAGALGTYSAKVGANEKGPYIIRTLITEYVEKVAGEKREVDLLVYDREVEEAEGVVGIDVEVIDGTTGAIVAAFPVHGTMRSKSANTDATVFSRRSFAQSLFFQATRVALNQAAIELHDRLKSR